MIATIVHTNMAYDIWIWNQDTVIILIFYLNIYNKPTLKNRVPTTLPRQTPTIAILLRNFIFKGIFKMNIFSPTFSSLIVSSNVEKLGITSEFKTFYQCVLSVAKTHTIYHSSFLWFNFTHISLMCFQSQNINDHPMILFMREFKSSLWSRSEYLSVLIY